MSRQFLPVGYLKGRYKSESSLMTCDAELHCSITWMPSSILSLIGSVSDSEFDFERDVACVNSPVRHRSRGRVLRASARVGPQGCSRERPRVQQRLHLRTRKNARFWPRALLVAGSMSHRAFNFENEDAWVRSLVGQSVRGRVLHTPAYVWTRERGSACDNIA